MVKHEAINRVVCEKMFNMPAGQSRTLTTNQIVESIGNFKIKMRTHHYGLSHWIITISKEERDYMGYRQHARKDNIFHTFENDL